MANKFIKYRGKNFYLAHTFNSKAKADEFKFTQRRYGVVCTVKKEGNNYNVYCPYSAADVILTKKRARPSIFGARL